MITSKNIDWYLESPDRLLKKKAFTRGGKIVHQQENLSLVALNASTSSSFSQLNQYEVTQDQYLQEYDPTLHKIKYNKSIPKIAVQVGGRSLVIDDMVLCASFQKVIHAAHVLHLTANPMLFTLCNRDDNSKELFDEYKQEWLLHNMESVKYEAISKQKKVGDVGVLFTYDPNRKKGDVNVYSYDEGYIVIPNYNEYREQIACSLYYQIDGANVIDTYDDTYHYRCIQNTGNIKNNDFDWVVEREKHGFSRCPLLYHRGKVAWEYAESMIEMWELMANINAIALKRFGTFGLVLTGQMDEKSFIRDNSTLIINLDSDTSMGKQDAKTIEFPEPQKMIDYLDFLVEQISIASSTSFITPKDITSTGSGGNGIFLSMKNDLALATQSVNDYARFTNGMARLAQELFSLESGRTNKFTNLRIQARFSAWSMESTTTKITNLAMEKAWLSNQTIVENSPSAAPDELERLRKEQNDNKSEQIEVAKKAENIARNQSSGIIDGVNKNFTSEDIKNGESNN